MIDAMTNGEKAIAAISSTTSLTLGLWVGIWSLPAEALAVPKNHNYNGAETVVTTAYTPVPNWLPLVSALIVIAGVYVAWHCYKNEFDDQTEGSQ